MSNENPTVVEAVEAPTPPVAQSYDSIYSVKYDAFEQVALIHDLTNDLYTTLEPQILSALVRAYFSDPLRVDRILRHIYGSNEIKISFATEQAAIVPPASYDFSNMTMKIMHEMVGMKFKDKDAQRAYFQATYGISI